MSSTSYLKWAKVPTTAGSGTAFSIQIGYQAQAGASVYLAVDAGFTVSPTREPLPDQSTHTFDATITRGAATTAGCVLVLSVGDTHAYNYVVVT